MVGELIQAAVKNVRKRAGISGASVFPVVDAVRARIRGGSSRADLKFLDRTAQLVYGGPGPYVAKPKPDVSQVDVMPSFARDYWGNPAPAVGKPAPYYSRQRTYDAMKVNQAVLDRGAQVVYGGPGPYLNALDPAPYVSRAELMLTADTLRAAPLTDRAAPLTDRAAPLASRYGPLRNMLGWHRQMGLTAPPGASNLKFARDRPWAMYNPLAQGFRARAAKVRRPDVQNVSFKKNGGGVGWAMYDQAKVWSGVNRALPQYRPGYNYPGSYYDTTPPGNLYRGFIFPGRATLADRQYGKVPMPHGMQSRYDLPEFRPETRQVYSPTLKNRRGIGSHYDPMPKYRVAEAMPTRRGIGAPARVYGWAGQEVCPMCGLCPCRCGATSDYDAMPEFPVENRQVTRRGIGKAMRVYGWTGDPAVKYYKDYSGQETQTLVAELYVPPSARVEHGQKTRTGWLRKAPTQLTEVRLSGYDAKDPMPQFPATQRTVRRRGIGTPLRVGSPVSTYDPMPKYRAAEAMPTHRGIGAPARVYGWAGYDPIPTFYSEERRARLRGIRG